MKLISLLNFKLTCNDANKTTLQTYCLKCVSSKHSLFCTHLTAKLLCSPWCQDTNPLVLPNTRQDNKLFVKKKIVFLTTHSLMKNNQNLLLLKNKSTLMSEKVVIMTNTQRENVF